LRRCYVDFPTGQIHCRYAETEGPWIFLIHQFPLSCRQFERVIPRLGVSARAYGLDLPGYGVSPPPVGALSIPEYASAALGAIDALGAQRFAIVGIETGVAVAAEIVRQAAAGRVTHAVLMATPPLHGAERDAYIDRLGEPGSDMEQDGRHLSVEWNRFEARWGPDCDKSQLRMAVSETFYVYGRYHWGIRAFAEYDLTRGLRALNCPVLFLSADLDSLAPYAETASRLVRQAEYRVLSDVRPTAPWAAPERVQAAITQFVGG
jgi:pimeloyl-ACP methyl ester carboxylesterase